MRLLLTGATGFVGRNFLLDVIRSGRYQEILVPVRSLEKLRAQFLGDGFSDIPPSVRPMLASAPEWDFSTVDVDHVVHSAGVMFERTREDYFKTNVQGTLNLLRRFRGPRKVVILSSMAAAGPCSKKEIARAEDGADSPLTWYGESKLEMERQVAAAFPQLNTLFLRPPLLFGPRDQGTLPLFKMVRQPVRFKPGFKTKYYSYLSVFDLITAIVSALEDPRDWGRLPHRHFFVASEKPVSDRDLIQAVAQVCQRDGKILSVPQPLLRIVSRVIDAFPPFRTALPSLTVDRAREIWPDRWVFSSDAFTGHFGWRPQEELLQSLKATYDWYVKTRQISS